MFTCRACGHTDMVHRNWTGCCGHQGCECLGMDGNERCADHGENCWWAVPKHNVPLKPEDVTVELLQHGNGYRYRIKVEGEQAKIERSATKAVRWVKDYCGVEIERPAEKPNREYS